uniref:Uncharacterized protein n=1 Tax=Coptotermes formosanus TaxID=36987 RepID=R4UJJ2_COPFO|nr:hypothetical protein [Coptotermes formosanus]
METEYRSAYGWTHGEHRALSEYGDPFNRPTGFMPHAVHPTQKNTQIFVLNTPFAVDEGEFAEKIEYMKSHPFKRSRSAARKRAERELKRHGRRSFRRSRSGKGKNIVNYGNGNVNPPNPDLFMHTFNIKSQSGINPHALMAQKIRPFIQDEYCLAKGQPDELAKEPIFYPNHSSIPKDRKNEIQGPVWVSWPRGVPVPRESIDVFNKRYAEEKLQSKY